MGAIGPVILILDKICLGIFVVELALKLYAHRAQFWRSGWNIFDFIIIAIALMPATQGFSVLRALRILRLLRVVSVSPSLRRVVEGFISALPGMGSGVFADGDDFLHWRRDGHQAVPEQFFRNGLAIWVIQPIRCFRS